MKKCCKICLIGLIIVFMIYLCGVIVFWNRFSLRIYVNGESVAFQSPEEVTLDLLLETQSRQFVLIKNDGDKEYVSFKDLGVYCESDDAFVGMNLSSWLWFLDIFHKQSYDLSRNLFYSRVDMLEQIERLSFVTGVLDNDISKLSVVEKDGVFDLVYVNNGSYVDTERLLDVICEHIDNQDFMINLVDEGCYASCDIQDVLVDGDMTAKVQDVEMLTNVHITIQVDDDVKELVPMSVLQSVVYQDFGVWMLNPYVLAGYVSTLAQKYDTVGMTRMFQKQGGDVLKLVPQEIDTFRGYELNQGDLLLALLNAISCGEDTTVAAPWYSMGRSVGDLDIGDTYVEISISDQHLWYYQNGSCIVDTDVVTGRDSDGYRTPKGMFSVMSLNTNYMMYYEDGSSKADYFIQLTGDGVGIHDSKNRSLYGGDIWRDGGSHGCINVPYDAEQQIFESLKSMSDFHIPVIIY